MYTQYTYYNNARSNKTKQPVTCTISATGRLKGVLIPVSKTGVSPTAAKGFYLKSMLCFTFTIIYDIFKYIT